MKTLILGARGFLASRLSAGMKAEGVAFKAIPKDEVNLLDDTASDAIAPLVERDDAVVVTSALTPDRGRDVGTLMKNLKMAENLCQAFANAPPGYLLYVSSDAVYPTLSAPISEDSLTSATDLYSLMHIARERMLAHVAQERNIPFCVLRPCAIYGSTDTHNSYGPNRFARTALSEGIIKLFGEGEEQRDHVFIDDVATVIRLAVTRRTTGTFNVVSGTSMSFQEVARAVAAAAGRPVDIQNGPRSGPITHRHFDNSRLRVAFPDLTLTSFIDGIRRTVDELAAQTSAAS